MTATSTNSSHDLSQWTDDQESALLKAIVRYKPVGMHKHFRMIAIQSSLLDSGTVNTADRHTSTSGIWQKLNSLYDLPKLDEREDSIVDDSSPGDEDSDEEPTDETSAEYWRDFELPRDDYEMMMWERRLKTEGSESPSWSRRGSTIADTDEPRSSPVSTAGGRGSRGAGRGGAAGKRGAVGRLSKLQIEIENERSRSRRASKTGSAVDEDSVMEDAVDEEGGDDGDENVEDSVEGAEEETDTGEDDEKKATNRKSGRAGRTSTPTNSVRKGRGRRGRRRVYR